MALEAREKAQAFVSLMGVARRSVETDMTPYRFIAVFENLPVALDRDLKVSA